VLDLSSENGQSNVQPKDVVQEDHAEAHGSEKPNKPKENSEKFL